MASRRIQVKTAAIVLMALCAVGLGVWLLLPEDVPEQADRSRRARLVRGRENAGKSRLPSAKKKKTAKKIVLSDEARDRFRKDMQLWPDEEAKLTAQMLAIYRDLQDALDNNDRKRVFALVHKLQAMDEWPDGIPASVKKRALAALAWFGASGIAEAVGFLADSDPEIRQMAVETFEQQFNDSWGLGDKKLGETMKEMVKVVTDSSALETFFGEFRNMRPSVKADTAIAIYESENENAIKVLEANMGDIFDSSDFNYEVKDLEDIRKYQKDAKEAELDDQTTREYDDLYGPSQDWDW